MKKLYGRALYVEVHGVHVALNVESIMKNVKGVIARGVIIVALNKKKTRRLERYFLCPKTFKGGLFSEHIKNFIYSSRCRSVYVTSIFSEK